MAVVVFSRGTYTGLQKQSEEALRTFVAAREEWIALCHPDNWLTWCCDRANHLMQAEQAMNQAKQVCDEAEIAVEDYLRGCGVLT